MMNDENGRLQTVDALLEQFSRVAVPPDVERRLEAHVQEFRRQSQPQAAASRSAFRHPSRRRMLRTWAAAGLAAAVVASLFVAFGHRDAWAQVVNSLRSKSWVRVTLQISKGAPIPKDFAPPEMWFSAEHKVAARRMDQAAQYIDFASQETYDYDPHRKTLNYSLTNDTDNVEFGHFETLLRLLSEGDRELKLPTSPIQVVGRTRRDVTDGDRRWTEFTFECRDARHTPNDYRVTFRVDPEKQLPVEMRSTEKFASNDPAAERTYSIDYPAAGPEDIYALGVPRDAQVVDRTRKTKNGPEIKEFLAAYDKARGKRLEPFSVVVLASTPQKNFSDTERAFRGRHDGQNVQLEEADGQQLLELRQQCWSGQLRPDNVDPAMWWRQQIAGLTFALQPPCDELLPHRVGCPNLTLGPPLVNNPDCDITLDRQPVSGPAGTVLLTIQVETKLGFNRCFYWIAPERDYMVLRKEMHFSRNQAWDNVTQIIDKVQQSPGGRWYATEVRLGRIEKHGDDLPAEEIIVKPDERRTGMEIGPVTTTLLRYFVEFD
ncbi:MAG TPA: hypothetical protein VHC22_16105 [Pirellulales bacterium]|nr:hypothetical protein [Pirellulales bacterium]